LDNTHLLTISFLRQKRESHRGPWHARSTLGRFGAGGGFAILGPDGQRDVELLLGLELARLEALRHHLGVLAVKFCFILWVNLFFFSRDNDGLLLLRVAVVVGRILLDVL
jgi:hypothetical protein